MIYILDMIKWMIYHMKYIHNKYKIITCKYSIHLDDI